VAADALTGAGVAVAPADAGGAQPAQGPGRTPGQAVAAGLWELGCEPVAAAAQPGGPVVPARPAATARQGPALGPWFALVAPATGLVCLGPLRAALAHPGRVHAGGVLRVRPVVTGRLG